MQEQQAIKSHEKGSEFFASKQFRTFRDELAVQRIRCDPSPFLELSFKCCGYGYFPLYKKNMKDNFVKYLEDALKSSENLMTLKLIFNGFDVSDGCLERILKAVGEISGRQKLRTVWIQTTNLRKCSKRDFQSMFTLIDKLGNEITCEEINFTMADWQFEEGYPNYRDLVTILGGFAQGILDSLKFRKFRLEMSSWYMKDGEAYNLLKDTLSNDKIRENLLSSREGNNNNQNLRNSISRLNEDDKKHITDALDYFLQHMDEAYLKPTYKIKKQDERYNKQDQKAHKEMIKKMAESEDIISKKLIKYPNEYILQLKVEEFHKSMTAFLGGVLYKLPYIQEYHIDFRNWHGKFGMAALKKTLDTRVNSKQEFSLIRRSLGLASKAIGRAQQNQGEEEVGLKTIYNM